MRSIASSADLASCFCVRDAESGIYRGGSTIPVFTSAGVPGGSWRVMDKMEANDSMR